MEDEDIKIRISPYGLDLDEGEIAEIEEMFEEVDLGQYLWEECLAIAYDADGIVGAITEMVYEEWLVGVFPDFQQQGLSTRMVIALIEAGATGFMTAGTDAGLEWLWTLYGKLTPEQRMHLDVPSWESLEY